MRQGWTMEGIMAHLDAEQCVQSLEELKKLGVAITCAGVVDMDLVDTEKMVAITPRIICEGAAEARQKYILRVVDAKTHAGMLKRAGVRDRARLYSSAGEWNGPIHESVPSAADGEVRDEEWRTWTRWRLGLPLVALGLKCQHQREDGSSCGAALDVWGDHCWTCKVGEILYWPTQAWLQYW